MNTKIKMKSEIWGLLDYHDVGWVRPHCEPKYYRQNSAVGGWTVSAAFEEL